MAEEKLVRGIGRLDLTAIAVNNIIGTGIFLLPAKVSGLIGNYSLVAFVACALIVSLFVLCFAEVSSRFQSTGGMYLYAREAFGPAVGFEVGWLYWLVRVTTFATNVNAMIVYIDYFYAETSAGPWRIPIIAFVVIALAAVNYIGVRQSSILTNVFTVGKLVPLFVFALVGLFFIQPANFTFAAAPTASNFSLAVLALIYAFVGFEAAVIPAGETKDPQKSVPFALLTAIGLVAVLFMIVQTVAIGTLPGLAESKQPLAQAAANFLGVAGFTLIMFGAVVSALGNLNGGFLAGSRIPYAMAEQDELPAIFGRTHPAFKTPWVSIVATAAAIFLFTVMTTFFTALTIATITRLLVYATTCGALIVFRYRNGSPEAKFTAPFGVGAAVLSLVVIGWLLTQVDYTKEGLVMLVMVAVGLALWLLLRFFGRKKSAAGPF